MAGRPRLNRETEDGIGPEVDPVIVSSTPKKVSLGISFKDWSETRLNYPREVFSDEYYRLVYGQEEHYKALTEGWVEDRADDHPYAPWSSSPEMVAKAAHGIALLKAQKAAEDAAQTPKFTTDLVAAMIEKQFAERMAKA